MAVDHNEIFSGGELIPAHCSRRIELVNPATETPLGSVPDGDAADVDRVVRAARAARSEWQDIAPVERGRFVCALAGGLRRHAEAVATLVTRQNGMPISQSMLANVVSPVEIYDYYVEAARGITASRHVSCAPRTGSRLLCSGSLSA